MVIVVDVGNTHIVLGGFEEGKFVFSGRISTDIHKTKEEYGVLISQVLAIKGVDIEKITGGMISSVVPSITQVLKDSFLLLVPQELLVVKPGIKTQISIQIDNPAQLGSDLLCTAVGCVNLYPLPAIIIDFGTATKITVVDKEGNFCGGAIAPGVCIGIEALSQKTAQLPYISFQESIKKSIGTNTVDCMKSGIILGTAMMIDGMVKRYTEEIGEVKTVVACGGLAGIILPYCNATYLWDEHLLLKGLYYLYEKNTGIKDKVDLEK